MQHSSFSTSASEALYELATAASRTVVVIGTAKNVGKTTTFNALRAIAQRRNVAIGVTSIGRDGEPFDALDGAPKPRVRLAPGTLVALPSGLMPSSPALEILGRGAPTALGRMVFARVVLPTPCEIGGPPSAHAMRETIGWLRARCAGPVFVDGAIDRVAALAGGDDAVVVATGAAAGASIAEIAAAARETIARLRLPARDRACERGEVMCVSGALDARQAERLLERAPGATIVVRDPTRVVVRGALFERLTTSVNLRCERPLHIVAVTTCSVSAETVLPPRELAVAVANATGLPAFDIVANLAA